MLNLSNLMGILRKNSINMSQMHVRRGFENLKNARADLITQGERVGPRSLCQGPGRNESKGIRDGF